MKLNRGLRNRSYVVDLFKRDHHLKCIVSLFLILSAQTCLLSINHVDQIAVLAGEHYCSSFGSSMATLDFNRDGYDDLAVCAFSYGYEYPTTSSRGKVYIYFGGPEFNSATPAGLSVEGDYPQGEGRRILSIDNAGDMNGDGYDDLFMLVLYPDRRYFDECWIYFSGGNSLQTPDIVMQLPAAGELLSIRKLGDIDGDGFADLGWGYISVNYYFAILWGGSFEMETFIANEGSGSYTCELSGVGDVNNDGLDDFCESTVIPNGSTRTYLVRLFYGNILRDYSNQVVLYQSPNPIITNTKPLGDLNNDGCADFLAYIDSQNIKVLMGAESNILESDLISLSPRYFGNSTLRASTYGDFNNDGFDDVISASYNERKFVIWLGGTAMNGFCDLTQLNVTENFGYYLVTGDYNGDGTCDIAVSAPSEDIYYPNGDFVGWVYIYSGNEQMVANSDPIIPVPSEPFRAMLSPNPVKLNSTIKIKILGGSFAEGDPVDMEVYNVKGQLVCKTHFQYSKQGSSSSLEGKALKSGVYMCKLTSKGVSAHTKFTIVN